MSARALGKKTVLLSRRVEAGVRPGFLYREEPDTALDSGWRAMVGDETPAEADDPLSIRPHPVADLVERWPEARTVIEADRTGEWRWDEAAGTYVPLARTS